MKTHDTSGQSYSETGAVVADEGMSEDEAHGFLSDEELAALKEDDSEESEEPDDATDRERNAAERVEDSDDTDNEEQSDEDESTVQRSPKDGQQLDGAEEADPGEPDGEQAAEGEGDGEDGLTEGDPFAPKYQFQADDIEARQEKLDTDYQEARSTLEKMYAEGDIDDVEFQRRRDAINEIRFQEQRKIDKDAIKAEIAREQQEQTRTQTWDYALAKFMNENQEIQKSRVLTGAMQAELNAIGEEYADRPISYSKMLDMAKERVYRELGRTPPKAKPQEVKQKAVKDLAKQRGSKPAAPKTLGDVPSDKSASSAFDDIEALSGLAYEDAIARMTADELSQWSR